MAPGAATGPATSQARQVAPCPGGARCAACWPPRWLRRVSVTLRTSRRVYSSAFSSAVAAVVSECHCDVMAWRNPKGSMRRQCWRRPDGEVSVGRNWDGSFAAPRGTSGTHWDSWDRGTTGPSKATAGPTGRGFLLSLAHGVRRSFRREAEERKREHDNSSGRSRPLRFLSLRLSNTQISGEGRTGWPSRTSSAASGCYAASSTPCAE